MTPEPYVTADDVAEHLKITRRQVLEMTRRGLLPSSPAQNDNLARRSSNGTIPPGSSPSQRRKSNG